MFFNSIQISFFKNDNSMIDITSKESSMFKEDYELLSCNDRYKLMEY